MQRYANGFGIDDLNHVRNGLLWCDFVSMSILILIALLTPCCRLKIENAFEHWAICFSFGLLSGEFICHVLDKKWIDCKLLDKAHSLKGNDLSEVEKDVYRQLLGNKTFR
jgi:hypothetical protein